MDAYEKRVTERDTRDDGHQRHMRSRGDSSSSSFPRVSSPGDHSARRGDTVASRGRSAGRAGEVQEEVCQEVLPTCA